MGARLSVDESVRRPRPRLLPALALAGALVAAGILVSTTEQPLQTTDAVSQSALDTASLSEAEPEPYQTLGRPTGVTAIALTTTHLALVDLDTAEREIVPLPRDIEVDTIDVGRRMLLRDGSLLIPNGANVWSVDLATGAFSDRGSGEKVAPAVVSGHA